MPGITVSFLDLIWRGKKNSDDLVTAIFDDAPLKNETSGEVKISAENCLFHPFYTSKKSSPTIKKRPLADIISASPAAVRPLHRRSAQGLWTHRMASAIATWPICRGPTGRRTSTWGHAGHAGHARRWWTQGFENRLPQFPHVPDWIALEDLGGLHFQTWHPCGIQPIPRKKKTHPPKNVWAHQGRILIANYLIANNHTQWLIEYLFLAVHRSGDEIKNDESDETRVSTCQGGRHESWVISHKDHHILRPPSSQAKSMISWLLTQGRTHSANQLPMW